MAKMLGVKEGQRYAQRMSVRDRAAVWKVGSILFNVVTIPHVCLISVEDPLHTKTVSCVTLTNNLYYELVADHPIGMG